jgi:hypothetical protein
MKAVLYLRGSLKLCSYLLHYISEFKNNSGTCPGNLYSYFDFREYLCREGSTVRVGVNETALHVNRENV